MKTFEKYLEEDVWEPEGVLDDDMPDAFEAWLEGLDIQEVIDYAEQYGGFIADRLGELTKKYTNPKPEFDGITWNMILAKVK